jgi:hypothetical protein
MQCPQCRAEYFGVICEACATRKSREAILQQQTLYLADVFTGKYDWNLRPASKGKFHLELFNDKAHAFCGVEVHGKRSSKQHATLLMQDEVCPACRDQVAALSGMPVQML